MVAANVRAFAKAKGMSLNRLADFAVMSRSQLFALLAEEGGTLVTVAKLAAALGVEPWQLLKPGATPVVRGRRPGTRQPPRARAPAARRPLAGA